MAEKEESAGYLMYMTSLSREFHKHIFFFPVNKSLGRRMFSFFLLLSHRVCLLILNEKRNSILYGTVVYLPESSAKERRKTGRFSVISRSLECYQSFFVFLPVQ